MASVIGFDSAWTDNIRARGAVCAIVTRKDGPVTLVPPCQASFDEALAFITIQCEASGTCLVAIDQPTIVKNETGCRPVDRVAASLVSFIGGGVQPANLSKTNMFGDKAPIGRFKKKLGATENPEMSRTATSGLFIIEVYPYLALPALNSEFSGRLKGPKYNPANKKFQKDHWFAVIKTIVRYARVAEIEGVERWAQQLAEINSPKKAEQDRLDSVLCALIGYHWRAKPRTDSVMIGDLTCGYMVAPTEDVITRARLEAAAKRRGVPII